MTRNKIQVHISGAMTGLYTTLLDSKGNNNNNLFRKTQLKYLQ